MSIEPGASDKSLGELLNPPPASPVLQDLTNVEPRATDKSAAALESALQKAVDDLREERSFWILGVALLLDFAVMQHLSWVTAVLCFLFEFVLLIALIKKVGDEKLIIPLDRLFNVICDKFLGKN